MKRKRKDAKCIIDNGKTILRARSEEPASAKANWQLWKLARNLDVLGEISVLITKRRTDIRYLIDRLGKCDDEEISNEIYRDIKVLRRDIRELESAYEILKRKQDDKQLKEGKYKETHNEFNPGTGKIIVENHRSETGYDEFQPSFVEEDDDEETDDHKEEDERKKRIDLYLNWNYYDNIDDNG